MEFTILMINHISLGGLTTVGERRFSTDGRGSEKGSSKWNGWIGQVHVQQWTRNPRTMDDECVNINIPCFHQVFL